MANQRRAEVPADRFVVAWLECASQGEVARKLGMTPSGVSRRASALRTAGVNLKPMPGKFGRKPLDVAALNRLIETKAAGEEPPAPECGRLD